MKDLENNKIVAAILVAGLLALVSGKVANFLYQPDKIVDKRGFQIENTEQTAATEDAAKEEAPIDIKALLSKADANKGQEIFKRCGTCHTNVAGAGHRIGPNLHGVVNAPIAHHADFAYSDDAKKIGGNWTHENLFKFLSKPRSFIAGTKMTFAGLKDPKEIADVIKYLEQN